MKILMMIDRMGIGGAETHVFDLVRGLCKTGEEVTLLCAGGGFAERLAREGVRVVYAPLDRRDATSMLRAMRTLLRLCREGFDAIHAHTRYTARLAACTPVPLTVTAHLPFPVRPHQRIVAAWGRITLAVSADIRAYLVREYGIEPKNVRLTINGIDRTRFPPLSREGRAIVHVSRLDRGRSHTALLLCQCDAAIARGFDVLIVGDGDDMPRVRCAAERADRRCGRTAVRLLGACENVAEVLTRGMVFVGVSRAALEAMSMGLAVILCGDEGYGGIVDAAAAQVLAESNFCARGCPMPNARTLERDLLRVLGDARLRSEMRAASRATIEGRDVCVMVEDARRVYRELCQKTMLLVGYYGFGNLGDECILETIKRLILQRNDYKIEVLSASTHLSPVKIQNAVRSASVVVFGGGTLFQNETSNRSLLYYAAVLRLAAHMKKPIYLLGCGIDPVRGKRMRGIVDRGLSRVRGIYVRTPTDRRCIPPRARSLPCTVGADLCFCMKLSPVARGDRVAFVLCGGLRHDALERLAKERYARTQIRWIALHPTQDMADACRAARQFGGEPIAATDLTVLREALDGCKLVWSERLHGGILALLLHLPVMLSCHAQKHRALIAQVRAVAREVGVASPLNGYCDEGMQHAAAVASKKEVGEDAPDFSVILNVLRERAADMYRAFVTQLDDGAR